MRAREIEHHWRRLMERGQREAWDESKTPHLLELFVDHYEAHRRSSAMTAELPVRVATLDMSALLADLAAERPVFHSEADFQHALAWLLHERNPHAQVRLEMQPPHVAEQLRLDLWIALDDQRIAIETKYMTARLVATVNGERFALKGHGAQDTRRYDVLRDVQRLERIVGSDPAITGYAVLLTNDSSLWRPTRKADRADRAFHLHTALLAAGVKVWGASAGAGTMKGREAPIELRRSYPLAWIDYSTVQGTGPSQFRALLVAVRADAH